MKEPHVAAQPTKQDETVQPAEHDPLLEHPITVQPEPQRAQPPRPHAATTAHPADAAESDDEQPSLAMAAPAMASAVKTAPSDFSIRVHPTRPWDAPGRQASLS